MAAALRAVLLWYGRLIGTANALYGAWLVVATIVNIGQGVAYEPSWIVVLFLLLGGIGAISSVVFLLSIDGPPGYRNRAYRRIGWIVMFAAVLLPTSISFFLAPLTALSVGLAIAAPASPASEEESPATSE